MCSRPSQEANDSTWECERARVCVCACARACVCVGVSVHCCYACHVDVVCAHAWVCRGYRIVCSRVLTPCVVTSAWGMCVCAHARRLCNIYARVCQAMLCGAMLCYITLHAATIRQSTLHECTAVGDSAVSRSVSKQIDVNVYVCVSVVLCYTTIHVML